ncbi:hypothetical protein [Leeuwenhoekiella sp. NPDC079379]
MKTTVLAIVLFFTANLIAQTSTSITVTIDNAVSDEGLVIYGLYPQ